MRDIILVLMYGGALAWAIKQKSPFTALLVYFWISFMNPHRYSWGFAYDLPLAMGAAVVTFFTLVLKYDDIKFPYTRETYLFCSLWAFTTLTTIFSMYPDYAWIEWNILFKINLMLLITLVIVHSKDRLIRYLVSIILFIGFVGIKGAIFGFTTGGKYRVWGPPDSFLEDNNGLGLALVMLIPLCLFMKDLFHQKWKQLLVFGVAGALTISAILTYSRGALIGLLAVGGYYLLYAKHKIRAIILAVVVVGVAYTTLPDEWFNRMKSIGEFEEDRSANMRLNSWSMSFNLAQHHPLGGGFDCFTIENYDKYAPDPELGRLNSGNGVSTAHSIYFQVLATQGFGGLFLYLITILSMIISLFKIDKIGRVIPSVHWVSSISRGLIGSTVGFLASGAFLSLAFFDLYWSLFTAGIALKTIVYSGELFKNEPITMGVRQ
jgi:putative inorganic carbon (hco3(-)) transporter